MDPYHNAYLRREPFRERYEMYYLNENLDRHSVETSNRGDEMIPVFC